MKNINPRLTELIDEIENAVTIKSLFSFVAEAIKVCQEEIEKAEKIVIAEPKNKKAQINLDTLCTIQKSLVDKYNIVYDHYKEVR